MGKTIKKQSVVVILGHIDHGKTSILRAIKKIPFTGKKPGGVITQEIGAFEIEKEGKKITFLDTPGHEAFTQMKERGAKVADLAILVVSAIEGPREQTKEALEVIKEAKIPFIVAINKIDLPGADSQKVKRELAKIGVLTEDMGGETPAIETSAKTGEGIDDLLDLILILAEMKDLRAEIEKKGKGVIIESRLDQRRGPLATVILEEGSLKIRDIVGTPSTIGKVREIENSEGKKLKEILPGQAGLILGLEEVPRVGEIIKVYENLAEARENLKKEEKKKIEFKEPRENGKVLNLIIKTDCLGSLEAIENVISKIPQEKLSIRIVKGEVGLVSEEDLKLARTVKAFILAFRTFPDKIAKKILEREKIKIWRFDVIYELVETIRKLAQKVLEPEIVKKEIGKMKVLVDFWRSRNRQIVGGRIIEGEVRRQTLIEVWRGEELIEKGRLVNLQKNKKDIEKARKGEEVGILYEGEGKIKEDDTLIFFVEERRKVEI
jgi:translation initiation factor IF-2